MKTTMTTTREVRITLEELAELLFQRYGVKIPMDKSEDWLLEGSSWRPLDIDSAIVFSWQESEEELQSPPCSTENSKTDTSRPSAK